MTLNAKLRSDVFSSIEIIKTLKSSDNLKVREIYFNLTERFLKLDEKSFHTRFQFDIYKKSLQAIRVTYYREMNALANNEDYAICKDFFQIKMSIAGYLDLIEYE